MDTHAVHSRVEGEDEEHHEKTSVLKKMKAKARKFRDTITGHGHHGHEPEGHHTPDDHDLDEEDDEDVDDPDVHAAPIVRDSAVKKTDAPVQGDILKLPVVNFGDNRAGHDEREPVVPSERSNVNVSDPLRSNVPELHGTTHHGATHNSAATRRADAPVQGGTHFGETHHAYDPVVPKERSNVGISDPVRDSVPGQNRTTTGHEDLLGGARTKPSGPTTGSGLKHEEPKGLVDVIGGGSHAPHNTITTDVDPGKTRVKLGKTDVLGEGTPVPQGTPVSSGTHRSDMDVDPRQTFVSGQGGHLGESRVDFDRPIGLEEDPHSSKANSQAYTPSNYETKVTDPTKPSGPTTGSVLKHEEPKGLVDAIGEGSHAPHNTITTDVDPGKTFGSGQGEHLGQTRVKLGNTDVLGEGTPVPQTAPVSSGTHRSDMDVDPRQTFVSGQGGHLGESRVNVDRPIGLEEAHSPKANPQAYTPSTYETKVTDPTKSGGEEIGVTPMLHSFDKMNLDGDDRQHLKNGAKQNPSTGSHDQFSPDKPSNQGSSYAEKFSYATSAIADAAISAKNAVASKLGYGGNEPDHDDYSRGYITGAGKSGSSPRNKVLDPSTNQFRPAETPQVQGTIKADHDATTDQKPVLTGGSYTERISSAGSAIADKAISAKNVVASQLGYGATDQVHDREDVTRTNVHSGTSAADQHGKMITSNQAGQDKGVSVKDYFVEKLRPGEEDKALSEVMSETLHKPKPGVKQETGNSPSATPKGKVTESAEVRQRLGNTEGNENFVVDKIEETVGSMLGGAGKSDEERRQGLSSSAATGEEDQHQRVRVSGN